MEINNYNKLKKAVIYHILIDRFAGENLKTDKWDKPYFIGGNLKGIINKINYLKQLNIDIILLSPIFETTAYHGYHITNYYNISPHFGNIDDLKTLIDVCNENNMQVWVEFVPNHCSYKHPFFADAQTNKKSRYIDWFYFIKWPEKYLCFLNFKELPKFNLKNPEVSSYFIECAKYWIKHGIKGFKIDHIIGLPQSFIKNFVSEIKKFNNNVIISGEAWLSNIPFKNLKTLGIKNKYLKWLLGFKQEKVQLEYKNSIDCILDFCFRNILIENLAWEKNYDEKINLIQQKLEYHYSKYPEYFMPLTFLDNHDTNRFFYECNYEIKKIKKAFEIQLNISYPAIIYYGTEAGIIQKKPVNFSIPYSDLNTRMPFDWKNINKELLKFVIELIIKRKSA